MKTINTYLIKNYIGPFILTFCIALFVLVMQFLWKYLEDLIGKGLELTILAELFYYVILTLVPLALPLAVLLSSLMTFGNLGEYYELAALKSSGLSLQKIMRPLTLFIVCLSIGVFFFSNNILPYANLKWRSLIYDVTNQKPTINIKEGAFYNGINKYVIKVNKKLEDGISMEGIIIYDHSAGVGNTRVVTAEKGTMQTTSDKQYFVVNLINGYSYDETPDNEKKSFHPLVRSSFKTKEIKIKLSGFDFVKSDEELFKDNYEMMDIQSIDNELDSIKFDIENRKVKLNRYLSNRHRNSIKTIKTSMGISIDGFQGKPGINLPESPAISYADSTVLSLALANARFVKSELQSCIHETQLMQKPITYLNIVWHKKFTLSIACIVLFFIGAPLGAIIRKGGLGMPVVISVLFFILYWVISITGEKLAKEEELLPHFGMWISTLFFLPIGVILTYKASVDSTIFDISSYTSIFRKLFRKQRT